MTSLSQQMIVFDLICCIDFDSAAKSKFVSILQPSMPSLNTVGVIWTIESETESSLPK